MTGPTESTRGTVEGAFRAESGRALATLARMLGDLALAEDAVQDAFATAMRVWPEGGAPENPGAWITTTARNRAIDRLRREAQRPTKERAAAGSGGWLAADLAVPDPHPVDDDELRLLFTCCHPALAPEARVGLTLRLVCGLRTAEIARAFLQAERTIAQRLSRAKRKIRDAGIPLRVPPAHLLPERLPDVLACVYLLFTEGYAATEGDELTRPSLCEDAARLAGLLVRLLPEEPEPRGLLALIGFHDARRAVRSRAGCLVPLEEQDRTRWDRARIQQAAGHLDRALARRRPGPYQLQAAIAGLHAQAPSWHDTDWPQVVALYDELVRLAPSPVAEVSRAVALSYRSGPRAGLAAVDALVGDPLLERTGVLQAARADLLRRAGRPVEAAGAYRQALTRARTTPERRFLERRLAELGVLASGGDGDRCRQEGPGGSAVTGAP